MRNRNRISIAGMTGTIKKIFSLQFSLELATASQRAPKYSIAMADEQTAFCYYTMALQ